MLWTELWALVCIDKVSRLTGYMGHYCAQDTTGAGSISC
ncbi:hypothetical protein SOHN41_03931 [Shewanella sp. HN-41]|nr:hypothetical protein SOHN41_03931 [Shewanella sp. HN-41]